MASSKEAGDSGCSSQEYTGGGGDADLLLRRPEFPRLQLWLFWLAGGGRVDKGLALTVRGRVSGSGRRAVELGVIIVLWKLLVLSLNLNVSGIRDLCGSEGVFASLVEWKGGLFDAAGKLH